MAPGYRTVVVTKRKVVRARYNNVTRYWGSRNVHRMSRYLPIESSKSPMTPVPESNQQDGSWMDDDSATDLLEDQNLFLGQHSRSRRRNAENRTARDRNWAMIRSLIDESLHSGNPSQCANSDCIPRESEVLVITFAGPIELKVKHCNCAGSLASHIIAAGHFPSAPLSPAVAFSLDIIELFHDVLMMGSISKFAWANALRRFCIRKSLSSIPDLKKLWEYTYMNWLKSHQKEYDYFHDKFGTKLPPEHSLSEICPACYYRDDSLTQAEPFILSVDGNFQQRRFKRKGQTVQQPSQSPYFVDHRDGVAQQEQSLASQPSSGCPHHFAATQQHSPKSFEPFDQTGLMGAICRHGIPLRYLNLYRGEKYGATLHLITSIIEECPPDANFIVQYDIACKFQPHVRRLRPDLTKQLSFAMNSFHAYAHALDCQLIFSPLRCQQLALSDGEGGERDWASKAHLVVPCRVSTAYHRELLLSSQTAYRGQWQRQHLGRLLEKRHNRASKMQAEMETLLREVCTSLWPALPSDDLRYFRQLFMSYSKAQMAWFSGNSATESLNANSHPYQTLFVQLKKEETKRMAIIRKYGSTEALHDSQWPPIPVSADIIDRRLEFKQLSKLIATSEIALKDACQKREEWQPGRPKWEEYEHLLIWQSIDAELSKLKFQYASRLLEYRNLRTRIRGNAESTKQLTAINKRFPAIKSRIERVNKLFKELPPSTRPVEIDISTLDPENLETTFSLYLWTLEEARRRTVPQSQDGSYVKSPLILKGIDATYRWTRAREEVQLIAIEWTRLANWAVERMRALLNLIRCMSNAANITSKQEYKAKVFLLDAVLTATNLLGCQASIIEENTAALIQDCLEETFNYLPGIIDSQLREKASPNPIFIKIRESSTLHTSEDVEERASIESDASIDAAIGEWLASRIDVLDVSSQQPEDSGSDTASLPPAERTDP